MPRDPYKYFRVEARELLDELTRSLLQAEKDGADKSLAAKLLRLAHTLKGAAHVVKQVSIAQAAHTLEDILAPHRDGEQPISKQVSGQAMSLLAQIGAKLDVLQASPEIGEAHGGAGRNLRPTFETVRVELQEVEALLAGLSEAGVQIAATRAEVGALKRIGELANAIVRQIPSHGSNGSSNAALRTSAEQLVASLARSERALTVAVERTEREMQQSQERASRLRLLPVETVFTSLIRAAREAALSLGKQIEVETDCGAIRLDADVLIVLQDALLHLVRNAVAHGIESPGARQAAGKSPAGKIELKAERRGSGVAFVCRDDGAGIDIAGIRQTAVRNGSLPSGDAESLGSSSVISLLLHGGVSTAGAVTGTSGRGIGLDIVRDAAERLKGEVSIDTAPGRGTAVEICVPASLTFLNALAVESGGVTACLPLDSVCQGLRIGEPDIATSATAEFIPYQDRAIPFRALSQVLGQARGAANGRERKTAVVIASAGADAAMGVEKLLGTRSVLVRSLPAIADIEPVVAGASLDTEGNPVLVLDPARLVEVLKRGESSARSAAKIVLPVLIIDDSLTTRMVEQNILEAAGYRVGLARSAEEALRMAQHQRYGLFLVDIEMPGLDGFQFISAVSREPLLRDTPSILVSSRNSPEDRRRANELGAYAYFAKSEFDQTQFLETVAHLLE